MLAGDGEPDLPFVAGLGAFLVGHVCYVVAFVRAGVHGLPLLAGVLVVGGIAGLSLPQVLRGAARAVGRSFAGVVAVYAGVLAVMAVFAAGTQLVATAIGGVAFLVSDTLIARERFVAPVPRGPLAVIVTYHLAQFLIVLGLVRSLLNPGPRAASGLSTLGGMPRRPSRAVPVLVLHGPSGADPQAWYSWVADELRVSERHGDRDVRMPTLPGADAPVLADWSAVLDAALADLPDVGFDVVAHSTGALLWLHHAARASTLPRPDRVALVAPPSAAHIAAPTFRDVPLDTDAVRRAAEGTVLVGSDDDPLVPRGCRAGLRRRR